MMMKFLLLVVIVILGIQTQQVPHGYTPPTEIHFAVTADPSQMVFSWRTSLPTNESHVYVYHPGVDIPHKFLGSQTTYLASAGWIHTVNVTGLTPGSLYYYIVGSEVGDSELQEVQAAPEIGSKTNFTFAIYGDMGIFQYAYPTVYHVSQLAQQGLIDMIYHAGDMGYGNDRDASFYEVSWNLFFEQMQLAMEVVPYMTSVGNHEYNCGHDVCDGYSKNYNVYRTRFGNMPNWQSGSNTTMWFSFNYGNVHFVSISTETDYPNCPEPGAVFGDQLSWLEEDLQAADADSNVDWIIVVGHRPMYSSVSDFSSGGIPTGDCLYLQQSFESLFHNYHVDIYFNGHVHGYERTYPVYQSQVVGNNTLNQYINPPSTVYITGGSAGNIEGFYTNWGYPIPSWSASRNWPNPTHGYGIMEVNGANELRFTQYLNTLDPSVDNNYFDWFVITRSTSENVPAPPPPTPFQ